MYSLAILSHYKNIDNLSNQITLDICKIIPEVTELDSCLKVSLLNSPNFICINTDPVGFV